GRPEDCGSDRGHRGVRRTGPFRRAVAQLDALISERLQGVAAFAILLGFRWWAPLLLLVGWRIINAKVRGWVEKGVAIGHYQGGAGLRRASYYPGLAVDSPAAKEVRIFDLGNWIVAEYARSWLSAMADVWRGRRGTWLGIIGSGVVLTVAHVLV